MTAEERLAKAAAFRSCSHAWDENCVSCLAREAIALLRRVQKWHQEGDPRDDGTGEVLDTAPEILDDIDQLLDGEKP